MKKHKLASTLGGFLVAAGLVLSPSAAYSETRCEKMTDAQLRQALDQELAALENDHSIEDDAVSLVTIPSTFEFNNIGT